MHEIVPNLLWIGHEGDLHRPAVIEQLGIKAVIQVALAEQIPLLSRELLIAHFPIVDGPGNSRGTIAAALELTASLIKSKVPTLICCSAGMSRSPCIAAGGMAMSQGSSPDEALGEILRCHPRDVSPALWQDVCACVADS